MTLKTRFRKAVSSNSSSRKESASAPTSPASSSRTNSGFTTPTNLSRAPSTTQLPALLPSATATSSLKLTKTTSTLSKISLSLFRSSSSKKENWAKYAPKNYRFRVADTEQVATLNAWEWNCGSNVRGSVSSAFSGISPSRSGSMDIPRAHHVEDVASGR